MKKIIIISIFIIMCFIMFLFLFCSSDEDTSTTGVAGPGTNPPNTPQTLSATALNSQVILSWSGISDATGYNIYWSQDASEPNKFSNFKIENISGTTSYLHDVLRNGITYKYVVTAINDGGESDASSLANATPFDVLEPPQNVFAHDGYQVVVVNWDKVENANRYNLYYITGDSDPTTTSGTAITDVTSPYFHTGLTNATKYRYIVEAENTLTSMVSDPSSIVEGTPHKILPPDPGTWVYHPQPLEGVSGYYEQVIYDPNKFQGTNIEKPFAMWTDSPSVTLYRSDDGITWNVVGPCVGLEGPIDCDGTGSLDSVIPRHPALVYNKDGFNDSTDNKFKIIVWGYTGSPCYQHDFHGASEDGLNWTDFQELQVTNWPPGSKHGSYYIHYNPLATNTGNNPFDYTYMGLPEVSGCPTIFAHSEDCITWTLNGTTDASAGYYDVLTGSGSGKIPNAIDLTSATWAEVNITRGYLNEIHKLNDGSDAIYVASFHYSNKGINFMISDNFTEWQWYGNNAADLTEPMVHTVPTGSSGYPSPIYEPWHNNRAYTPTLVHDPNCFGDPSPTAYNFRIYYCGISVAAYSQKEYRIGLIYAREGTIEPTFN